MIRIIPLANLQNMATNRDRLKVPQILARSRRILHRARDIL